MNYEKYFNLEEYIFNEVADNFHRTGYLTALDFFCIVIWKVNRAKSLIARKFNNEVSLEEGVRKLTSSIYKTSNNKNKLAILINDYGFNLPMASAILSVLYKDDFSIYDVRVCDVLGKEYKTDKYHRIKNWTFERLWSGYKDYLEKTLLLSKKSTYREADKYLWSKSFYKQLVSDIESFFE